MSREDFLGTVNVWHDLMRDWTPEQDADAREAAKVLVSEHRDEYGNKALLSDLRDAMGKVRRERARCERSWDERTWEIYEAQQRKRAALNAAPPPSPDRRDRG